MALCPDCSKVIPCHCHVAPPVQVRPGVYLAGTADARRHPTAVPESAADTGEETQA